MCPGELIHTGTPDDDDDELLGMPEAFTECVDFDYTSGSRMKKRYDALGNLSSWRS